MDYKSSGVDIDAGNEVVRRVTRLAQATFTDGVLSDIGAFGGLFQPDLEGFEQPVLVASADGVGTKLKAAFLTGRHDTVGQDLVNHCVNDILVQGARPLFFLDYLATGRLSPDVSTAVIEGVAAGCRANRCALLGGETAEMPGFYADDEYDLAGFIVGLVDRRRVVDGQRIQPGDLLVGLPSSGLHTNGYSLARRILFDVMGLSVDSLLDGLEERATVGDVLLRPHRSYLDPVDALLRGSEDTDGCLVKGLAHITGGGLTDNLPRILPRGTAAEIEKASWSVPLLFQLLQREGDVAEDDMFRTFNMGIGLVVVCAPGRHDELRKQLALAGESESVTIGRVTEGEPRVTYQ